MLSEAQGIKSFKNIDDILGNFFFLDPREGSGDFVRRITHVFDSSESFQDFLRLRRTKEKRDDFCSVPLKSLDFEDPNKIENLIILDKLIQSQEEPNFNATEFIAFFDRKAPEKLYLPLIEGFFYELIQALLLCVIPVVEDVYEIVKECSNRDGFIGTFQPEILRGLNSYKKAVLSMEEKACELLFLVEEIYRLHSKMLKWDNLNRKYFSENRTKAFQGGWNLDVFLSSYLQGDEWRNLIEREVADFYGRVNNEIKSASEIIGASALKALDGEEYSLVVDEDIKIGQRLESMIKRIAEDLEPIEAGLRSKDELFLINQKTLGYKTTLRLLLFDFAASIDLKI